MLQIHCPYCQEIREEAEFTYAGEAFIDRPLKPEELSDEQWADYVFMRTNQKGEHFEQWIHTSCRKFFVVERNTINNKIKASYSFEEAKEIKRG